MILKYYIARIFYFLTKIFFIKPKQKNTGKGAVLMFHRILNNLSDEEINNGLAIQKNNFKQIIDFISKNYKIVTLDYFLKNINKSTDFLVCVTFDDGYKDNIKNALPILEKYNVPFTIYFSTGFFKKNVFIWWYELRRYLKLKRNIKFKYLNKKYHLNNSNKNHKKISYKIIRNILLKLNVDQQKQFFKKILNVKKLQNYKNLMINSNDLFNLSKNNLITIGCHSHNHLSLNYFNHKEILEDLKFSKKFLEKKINKKVNNFSYPFGSFNNKTIKVLKKLNFKSAVTTEKKPINRINKFLIPRIYISPHDTIETIKLKLKGFHYYF